MVIIFLISKETLESRGTEPLINFLNDIGGWPLISNRLPFSEDKYDRWTSLAKMNALYGETAIFDMSVSQDLKNNKRNILYVSDLAQFNTD